MSEENGQDEGAKVVFTSVEEADANPRHGKSKDGKSVVEFSLFTLEATRDIKVGEQAFAWAAGGGVAAGLCLKTLGLRVYKTHGNRTGGGMSAARLKSKWEEMTEEEKEEYREILRQDEKAHKEAAKAAKKGDKGGKKVHETASA